MLKMTRIFFTLLFLCFLGLGLDAVNLIDVYKKGVIKLVEDPDFGKGVDWIELFYDLSKELTIAPDGRIFVTNVHQNNVFIFNKEGRYIKAFGQGGQGPLDFIFPGEPSILDNRYLMVKDYSLNQKITLVDLENIDTKHVKVLKTKHVPENIAALKDNKIAYITRKFEQVSKWDQKRIMDVYIKDIISGKETLVASYDFLFKCRRRSIIVLVSSFQNYFWRVYIARSKEGNLIIGASDRPTIDILSPEGKKISSFNLNYKPAPFPKERREELMEKFGKGLQIKTKDGYKTDMDFKNAMSGSEIFGKSFPYYNGIMVDSSGNILFSQVSDCIKDCGARFKVYSPEGKYICDTKIDPGKFVYHYIYNFFNILFTEDGIYGLFDLKGAEDIMLRLVRVKLEDAMK